MLFICTPSSVKFIKNGSHVRARFMETDTPEGQAIAVDGGAHEGTNVMHTAIGKGEIQMELGE
jgi:hypothetical protein